MIRIEIHLDKQEVKDLDKLSKSQGRSRKNFCETEILRLINKWRMDVLAVGAVRQAVKN
jgi:hypothetical protein